MLNLFRLYCALSPCLAVSVGAASGPAVAAPAPGTLPAASGDSCSRNSSRAGAARRHAVGDGNNAEHCREASNNQKDWHFIGNVEMDRAGDTKIYADDVWAYTGSIGRRYRQRASRKAPIASAPSTPN
jgi:hypothetical protein